MTDANFDIRKVSNSHPMNLLLSTYAFESSPKVRDKEKDERYLHQRSADKIFFSYLDDEPVAKVSVIPMTINIRGTVLPMGGISGVASMPIARRGGHIRALMNHSIKEMHTDGQGVSALYPFRSSYYERFGYAGWQAPLWARIEPAALAPYLRLPKHGVVKQRLSTDAKDDAYAFIEASQRMVHGMSLGPRMRFDNAAEQPLTWFMSVSEGDDITGGMSYKTDLEKEIMEVRSVFWHTINAKLNVLDFLARHVDQVKQVRMPILPGENPYLWINDDWEISLRTNEEFSWGPPMGRIVTLAGMDGIAVGDAEATITVSDAQAPWNDGTWKLSGRDGKLAVSKGGTPGGEVSIAGLSAMLFSGLDPLTLPHRAWGSVNEETATALQVLFPPITPHLHELF